ncbi:hypothetical protein CDO73_06685 [Saccharibacillus sp. O23]|nr:hypothetical protein CDO73_06685 [Saccharibacillus sp. O23]
MDSFSKPDSIADTGSPQNDSFAGGPFFIFFFVGFMVQWSAKSALKRNEAIQSEEQTHGK